MGRFELADGGTLFLDEIANISLNLQAKLLRVLETGEFERVGSSRTRRVDVRILSATNADLHAEVAAGRFRQDLLFRLNTIEIRAAAAARAPRGHPAARAPLPAAARAALPQAAHRLRPGRDAAAARPRLAGQRPRAGPRRRARGADGAGRARSRRATSGCAPSREAAGKLEDMSLEEVEGFLIKKALARYDGNVSHAAKALGPQPQRALPAAPALRTVTGARAHFQPCLRRQPFTACELQVHAVRSLRRSFDDWLTHDRRVVLMALGAGLPGHRRRARPALVRRLLVPAPLDADAARRGALVGRRVRAARPRRSSRCRRSRTCWRRCARRTSRSARAGRGGTIRWARC